MPQRPLRRAVDSSDLPKLPLHPSVNTRLCLLDCCTGWGPPPGISSLPYYVQDVRPKEHWSAGYFYMIRFYSITMWHAPRTLMPLATTTCGTHRAPSCRLPPPPELELPRPYPVVASRAPYQHSLTRPHSTRLYRTQADPCRSRLHVGHAHGRRLDDPLARLVQPLRAYACTRSSLRLAAGTGLQPATAHASLLPTSYTSYTAVTPPTLPRPFPLWHRVTAQIARYTPRVCVELKLLANATPELTTPAPGGSTQMGAWKWGDYCTRHTDLGFYNNW